jgi:hypothetical protein
MPRLCVLKEAADEDTPIMNAIHCQDTPCSDRGFLGR